jgi:hypothetical protein
MTMYFSTNLGYFDPFGIKWIGDMAKLRVADPLPFDYILKKKDITDSIPGTRFVKKMKIQ